MKATVDEAKCAGTGLCEETCPQVFKVEGGVSKVVVAEVPAEAQATCREAMGNCPTDAITIQE